MEKQTERIKRIGTVERLAGSIAKTRAMKLLNAKEIKSNRVNALHSNCKKDKINQAPGMTLSRTHHDDEEGREKVKRPLSAMKH